MGKKKEKVIADKEEKARGIAKSGRFWKIEKQPFRKIQNSAPKKTAQQHLKLREEIKKIKALSNSIKEDKKQVRSKSDSNYVASE